MKNNLKKQLEFRKNWLEDSENNYNRNDFLEDWKMYQKLIERSFIAGLISEETHDSCKKVLMDYMYLFSSK